MQTRVPTKLEIKQNVLNELGREKYRVSKLPKIPKNLALIMFWENIPQDLMLTYDYIYNLEYRQFWNSIKCHSNYMAYVEDISNPKSPVEFSQIGLLS